MAEVNREQIEHWNERAGPTWVVHQEALDRQIRPHGDRALEALRLAEGDRVLDVGCGCGDSTLEIARRVGTGGEVLGVDISAPMLGRAEERAREAGLPQARFVRADAQIADLGEGHFDALTSRFGLMFFEDPARAFRNLARALRPGGRLAFVCWQPPRNNPWIMVPMAAVAPHLTLPPPPEPGAPGMFAFADPGRVRAILEKAGFEQTSIQGIEIRMSPAGSSAEDAAEVFLEVGPVAALLRDASADEALRQKVASSVAAALAPYATGERLELGSAIWLVTARMPG